VAGNELRPQQSVFFVDVSVVVATGEVVVAGELDGSEMCVLTQQSLCPASMPAAVHISAAYSEPGRDGVETALAVARSIRRCDLAEVIRCDHEVGANRSMVRLAIMLRRAASSKNSPLRPAAG
jgi:hypothetical protein